MINKHSLHTDPVREHNMNTFLQAKEYLEQQLSSTLSKIMKANEPLEDRIGACYSFMQDFSWDAAGEMEVSYSMDIHTKLVDIDTLAVEFCHNISIIPTEDLLEGRTDRLPVMPRGPDIPYIRT